MNVLRAISIGSLLLLVSCSKSTTEVVHTIQQADADGRGQLFDGLGDYHRSFNTTSTEAHKYLVFKNTTLFRNCPNRKLLPGRDLCSGTISRKSTQMFASDWKLQ